MHNFCLHADVVPVGPTKTLIINKNLVGPIGISSAYKQNICRRRVRLTISVRKSSSLNDIYSP